MRGWQEIAHHQFEGKNPRTHLLAHTDYNPEKKQQRQALIDYEKQHKRPPHAVESAFLASYMLQQSLVPFLEKHFHADPQQKFGIAYAVMMAAGRHHSAFTKGWGTKEIGKGKKLELHLEARSAIAQSWLCLTRFFPKSLSLPPAPILSNTSYPITEFPLNKLSPHQIAYLQLYSLVVRALRLCDMRSVQLKK